MNDDGKDAVLVAVGASLGGKATTMILSEDTVHAALSAAQAYCCDSGAGAGMARTSVSAASL